MRQNSQKTWDKKCLVDKKYNGSFKYIIVLRFSYFTPLSPYIDSSWSCHWSWKMEKSIEYTYLKLPLSTKHFLSQVFWEFWRMQSLPGPLPWMGPGSRLAGSIFCDFTVHLGIVLHDWYISKFCGNFFNSCLSCPNCPCMKFELIIINRESRNCSWPHRWTL